MSLGAASLVGVEAEADSWPGSFDLRVAERELRRLFLMLDGPGCVLFLADVVDTIDVADVVACVAG